MKNWLHIGYFCSVSMCLNSVQAQTPETTRAIFDKQAAQTTAFETGNVLYNRWDVRFDFVPNANTATELAQLCAVLKKPYPLEDLKNLARDPDPKIRTLALAALFEREDAKVLPFIVPLMRDSAPTFPTKPQISRPASTLLASGIDPRPRPQTVGEVASQMVSFYVQRAGYQRDTWPAYWAKFGDREFAASWFEVKRARASHGTSPTPFESAPALREVRDQIEKLPREDRNWTMLALWEGGDTFNGSRVWASQSEVLEAARELGVPKLIKMLQTRKISDDPDLAPNSKGEFRRRMQNFVLSHATQLLEPTMADAILEAERAQDGASSALWAQAAAELQPQRAAAILKPALQRFEKNYQNWERGQLMATLWKLAGESEKPFILQWFWSEKPDSNASPAGAPGMFLSLLKTAPTAPTKKLVADLLADKRLESLPKNALVPLALLVNDWAKAEIFEPRPLYGFERAQNPEDLALKQSFIAQARAAQPKWQ